jgi:hypothetical protein
MLEKSSNQSEQPFAENPAEAGQKLTELVGKTTNALGFEISSTEEDLGPRITISKDGKEIGVFRFADNFSATVGGPKKLAILLEVFNSKEELEPLFKEFSFENLESFVQNCFASLEELSHQNSKAMRAAA